jgi:hypothetical protein
MMVVVSLAERFFPAFLIALDNLAERDYFSETAATQCGDGHPYYWDPEKVRRALVGQMGRTEWPLAEDRVTDLSDEQIIEYVEAFFNIASAPTESWWHDYCGSSHPTKWDLARGRYDYTVTTNALFTRFDTGNRLQSGKVRSTGSAVLAPRLSEPLPFGGDRHLAGLVSMAMDKFKSPSHQDRWQAVRCLADAFERIKTVKDPSDKKVSIGLLVHALSPEEKIAQHLDGLLREVTAFSNELTIRHHEVGTTEIADDQVLIDFLFYTYYNVIRLALLRLFAADEGTPGPTGYGDW